VNHKAAYYWATAVMTNRFRWRSGSTMQRATQAASSAALARYAEMVTELAGRVATNHLVSAAPVETTGYEELASPFSAPTASTARCPEAVVGVAPSLYRAPRRWSA
jgi:hypothetical protein